MLMSPLGSALFPGPSPSSEHQNSFSSWFHGWRDFFSFAAPEFPPDFFVTWIWGGLHPLVPYSRGTPFTFRQLQRAPEQAPDI
jgi:hypothetical protein